MMDILQALTVKESQPHQKVIFQIAGLTIEPHPTQIMNISWKEYNFPPSYNLPIANAYGVRSFTQRVVRTPMTTEVQPSVVHTFAQGPFDDPHFAYQDVGSQNDDEDEIGEINEVKEKYEIM